MTICYLSLTNPIDGFSLKRKYICVYKKPEISCLFTVIAISFHLFRQSPFMTAQDLETHIHENILLYDDLHLLLE